MKKLMALVFCLALASAATAELKRRTATGVNVFPDQGARRQHFARGGHGANLSYHGATFCRRRARRSHLLGLLLGSEHGCDRTLGNEDGFFSQFGTNSHYGVITRVLRHDHGIRQFIGLEARSTRGLLRLLEIPDERHGRRGAGRGQQVPRRLHLRQPGDLPGLHPSGVPVPPAGRRYLVLAARTSSTARTTAAPTRAAGTRSKYSIRTVSLLLGLPRFRLLDRSGCPALRLPRDARVRDRSRQCLVGQQRQRGRRQVRVEPGCRSSTAASATSTSGPTRRHHGCVR